MDQRLDQQMGAHLASLKGQLRDQQMDCWMGLRSDSTTEHCLQPVMGSQTQANLVSMTGRLMALETAFPTVEHLVSSLDGSKDPVKASQMGMCLEPMMVPLMGLLMDCWMARNLAPNLECLMGLLMVSPMVHHLAPK